MKKQQQFEVKDVFIGLDVHRSFFVAGCICVNAGHNPPLNAEGEHIPPYPA